MCGKGSPPGPGVGPALGQIRKMRLTGRDRDRSRRIVLAGFLALTVSAARGEATRLEPLALNGFDPVSYFLPDGPQAGSSRFEARWDGRAWRFALDANRAAFLRDPTVYAPRLGGYDAAGILNRRIVDADPAFFALLDGRLYLFQDAARRDRFLADPTLARRAEAIWPGLTRLLDDPDEVRGAGR